MFLNINELKKAAIFRNLALPAEIYTFPNHLLLLLLNTVNKKINIKLVNKIRLKKKEESTTLTFFVIALSQLPKQLNF